MSWWKIRRHQKQLAELKQSRAGFHRLEDQAIDISHVKAEGRLWPTCAPQERAKEEEEKGKAHPAAGMGESRGCFSVRQQLSVLTTSG